MSHILRYSAIKHYIHLITNPSTSLLILQPKSTSPLPKRQPHTLLTLYWPHVPLHPCVVFCQPIPFQCILRIYFFAVLLILQFTHQPPPLSSSNFHLKTSHSFHLPIPPSFLSFAITIFTSRLSSIPSNLLPNTTFIPSLLSSSFFHQRSPCTTSPATVLLASNNLLPLSSVPTPAPVHTMPSWPPHFCCILTLGLLICSHTILLVSTSTCPFTLDIHVTFPIHFLPYSTSSLSGHYLVISYQTTLPST